MTVAAIEQKAPARATPVLFAVAVFVSAGLVFLVEPMIAKMILPQLGGSPAVWNTAMAFFQGALLVGYGYAHLLQRIAPPRVQALIHLLALAVAALFLPMHVTSALGPPSVDAPSFWLIGVLAVSIGVPFAALSATAPLLQAWFAQSGDENAPDAYVLYGASNLGSMLALLSYPVIVEPLAALPEQTTLWAVAYGAFCLMVAGIATRIRRSARAVENSRPARKPSTGRDRVTWVVLAAIPSSLMLGATTYVSNDVASVPLLWVIPLALYLLTFVIAFQQSPLISRERALLWQAVLVATAAGLLCIEEASLLANLVAFLGAFFFCALVCHQALVARKPDAANLTEFYLLMSLGGVVGGVFNAFLAPHLFNTVAEFPLVLVAACLVRPWGAGRLSRTEIGLTIAGVAAALAIMAVPNTPVLRFAPLALALIAGTEAVLVGRRGLLFTLIVGILALQTLIVPADKRETLLTARSFFGVNRVTADNEPALGGKVHLLFHGTTVHGGQALSAADRCTPTYYYAKPTPIGQTFTRVLGSGRPAARIAVVGLGSGTVAAYTRPGDTMRFFEIDPAVARIARDPQYFTYLSGCAKGKVDIVLGDARLTMGRETAGTYNLIQLDAFSGDSVPTHLLTVEAMRGYARRLRPGGLLLVHISNRNLALEPPVAASAHAAGLATLMQEWAPPVGKSPMLGAPSQVMLIAKTPQALAAFAQDPRWRPARDKTVRPWTDDYTNVAGALLDHMLQR